MIPLLRQQLHISMSKAAKQVATPHSKPRKKNKHHHPIHHYSLKNQRRIKKMRMKKHIDTDLAHMLHQEVHSHRETHAHLKEALKRPPKPNRDLELTNIHETITNTILQAQKMKQTKGIQEKIAKLKHLQTLIKQKMNT